MLGILFSFSSLPLSKYSSSDKWMNNISHKRRINGIFNYFWLLFWTWTIEPNHSVLGLGMEENRANNFLYWTYTLPLYRLRAEMKRVWRSLQTYLILILNYFKVWYFISYNHIRFFENSIKFLKLASTDIWSLLNEFVQKAINIFMEKLYRKLVTIISFCYVLVHPSTESLNDR